MARPTQKDVARRAGVSRSTVSYVLNDQATQKIPISPETRQRVLEAMADLGYEPDARAQSLRRGTTKTVGVLIPILSNPFYWELLQGISAEAHHAGYGLQIAHHPLAREHIDQSIREFTQNRVGGYILLSPFKLLLGPLTEQLFEHGRPVVELCGEESAFDHVIHAYEQGARVLMNHFFELGHRRIGLIFGVQDALFGQDRLIAYHQSLQAAGIAPDESLIERCDESIEAGYAAARRLLSRPDRPTAVLIINDLLALAAIRAAADLGLNIPADVSLASFDDIPFARFSVPRLTTISGNTIQVGRDVFQILLRRINDPSLPRQVMTADFQLLIRESTGPVPVSIMPLSARLS